jgi:hypothetical protein
MLWDVHDLEMPDPDGIAMLQSVGLRSLIKAKVDTQKENLHFLSKVLAVRPDDVVRPERWRLLDRLTRSFEFQTVGTRLDAIQAILACGSCVEDFNHMSVISLPRRLTLSVGENAQIRGKANAILRFFSHTSDDA